MRYEYAKIFVCWMRCYTVIVNICFFLSLCSGNVMFGFCFFPSLLHCNKKNVDSKPMHVSFKRFAIFVFGSVFVAFYLNHTNEVSRQNKQIASLSLYIYMCVWQDTFLRYKSQTMRFILILLHAHESTHRTLYSIALCVYLQAGFLAHHFAYLHVA